ncbi:NUMOD4 domain-containing protein [Pseudooceanicola sp. C21-150M6]
MEAWKGIDGWPAYEVSSTGRVRSLDRTVVTSHGVRKKLKGRVLRQNKNGSGYFQVVLSSVEKSHNAFVHRLVALTFLGQPKEGTEVCHIDGDKHNNRLENLRYGDRAANMADCKRHGTTALGERNPSAKITVSDVLYIRNNFDGTAQSRSELAEKFSISSAQLSGILIGKFWPHCGGPIRKKAPKHGERPGSKLTEEDVKEIISEMNSGGMRSKVAVRFGVSPSCITKIMKGLTWAHLPR